MSKSLLHKAKNLSLRKARVRSIVKGTADRPRLSVKITNQHISAQIINDEDGTTIASATTVGDKLITGNMTEKAKVIGTNIDKSGKKANVKKVSFDRNGKIYHGRIKALADAARAEGLEF